MNQQKIIFSLLLVGAILFNFLFWGEYLGVNLLLFTIFNIGALVYVNEGKRLSIPARITSVCTFLLALLVILNHSILSMVMFSISFFAMIGFVHQSELQLFFYGFLQSISNLQLVSKFSSGLKEVLNLSGLKSERILKYIQIAVLPIFILLVFYSLYYAANPAFASYSDTAWNWVIDNFTLDISFERIMFFIIGLIVSGMVVWKVTDSNLVNQNNTFTEQLFRKKSKRDNQIMAPTTMGLKTEFQIATMMFGMLNVLLFVVNLTDINFVWFNFEENPDYNLKTYVHQGTYILIASILLAMMIIIYYFRGNLNFYKENKKLKLLTYGWIIQNAILAFSLGIRNYRYIQYHGLAYKRIGVIIFLIAVIVGLVTMYIKVKEKRSLYFLINRNTWAVYLLLVISSFVNWDIVITKYNILGDTKRSLEIEVIMEQLSDKNLYLLKEYNDEILAKSSNRFTQDMLDNYCDLKRRKIENRYDSTSWLSWNYSDYKNLKLINLE